MADRMAFGTVLPGGLSAESDADCGIFRGMSEAGRILVDRSGVSRVYRAAGGDKITARTSGFRECFPPDLQKSRTNR